MSKSFKFAVSTADDAPNTAPILLLGDICDNLITASSLGYDAIEIHMRENEQVSYEKVLKTCQKYNMRIAAVVTGRINTQGGLSVTDASKEIRTKAQEGLKQYIHIAENFKSDIIIGWVRGKIGGTANRLEYEKKLAESLLELSEFAWDKNVRLLIEGINRYEIDSMNTALEMLEFIDKYKIKNTYAHLDTFHMNIEEVDIAGAIKACGDKLGYIHFADSNRRYPMGGHLDFKKILKALLEIKYDGYLSVECLPYPTGIEAAEKAIQNLKKLSQTL